MIMRNLMSVLAFGSAVALAAPAYAQVTDQTDQSEEDWRKSRKKSGSSDIYRDINRTNTGVGGPVSYEPVSPVERLPSESRRHLMRERAKAIAESEDGDISNAEYVPSEAAKSDEQLMREEQEAWEVIVTDMEGNGGEAQSEGGPNKVAVAGRNGSTPSQGSRGGSTRTLQEIMDAIKNGQAGSGGVSGTDQGSSQGQSGGQSQGSTQGQSQGDGQQGESQDQADNSTQSDGQSDGQSGDQAGDPSQSASNEQGDTNSDGASQEPADGEQGDGTSSPDASGSDGDDDANGDAADVWPAATRAEEPLSPLERIRRAQDDQPARGTQRSASDYLGTQSPRTDDD